MKEGPCGRTSRPSNVVDQHLSCVKCPTKSHLFLLHLVKRRHEDIEIADDVEEGQDDPEDLSFVEAFDATQEFLRTRMELRSFNDDVYWNMSRCGLWQQRIACIHSLWKAPSREAMMCALFQCTREGAEDLSHSFLWSCWLNSWCYSAHSIIITTRKAINVSAG